jgi:hypothetical protein
MALEECREDERERKRASRAAARQTAAERTCPPEQPPAACPAPAAALAPAPAAAPAPAPAPALAAEVSLTDLRGEALEKIDKMLKSWDARERVSLAGLRREVVGILGHFLGNAGRAGPVRPGCP